MYTLRIVMLRHAIQLQGLSLRAQPMSPLPVQAYISHAQLWSVTPFQQRLQTPGPGLSQP